MVDVIPVPIRHSHTHHHHHGGGSVDDGSSPNIAKATAMCCLFLFSFVLGCVPIKITRWLTRNDKIGTRPDQNRYVQMMLGFGGGVLMCTTFLHLLPEVSETFEGLDLTPNFEMHYAELLMCIGFFIMYLVEECVHKYLHRKEKENPNSPLFRTLSIRRGESTPRPSDAKLKGVTTDVAPSAPPSQVQAHHQEDHHHHHHQHNHGGGHSHMHFLQGDSVDSTVKAIRGLLIVLALSVHELFEGLSVGLESSAGNVWYMFGAVAAHKFVIAFCIGVELVSINLRTLLIVVYVFTFAVVSPLGIGIGLAVSNIEDSSTNTVSVFLQGIATGTLLYVVFFEILQNERKSGLRQFFAVFFGFACMFGLTIID